MTNCLVIYHNTLVHAFSSSLLLLMPSSFAFGSFILVFISLRNLERANNAEDKPFTLVASWPLIIYTLQLHLGNRVVSGAR